MSLQLIMERVMNMLQLQGKIIQVELCGLFVHHENCWLLLARSILSLRKSSCLFSPALDSSSNICKKQDVP